MYGYAEATAFNINPPRPMEIDLLETYRSLRRRFNVLAKSSLAVTISWRNGVEATLFRSGRMLVRNVKDADATVEVYDQVLKYFNADSIDELKPYFKSLLGRNLLRRVNAITLL